MHIVATSMISVRQIRFELWSLRSCYPNLYLPVARFKHARGIRKIAHQRGGPVDLDSSPPPVLADTEIVIEGFPRSANTFSVAAFRQAQRRPVLIAHHQHAAAQVVAAAKRHLPVIMLIREPDAAVISYLIQRPFLRPSQAIRHYIRFYRATLPFRERVVIAPFDEVTGDFGAVIQRVNAMYGTSFLEFAHTKENVEKCIAEMVRHEQSMNELDGRFEEMTSRPSAEREQLKSKAYEKLEAPHLTRARSTARDLYVTLTENL